MAPPPARLLPASCPPPARRLQRVDIGVLRINEASHTSAAVHFCTPPVLHFVPPAPPFPPPAPPFPPPCAAFPASCSSPSSNLHAQTRLSTSLTQYIPCCSFHRSLASRLLPPLPTRYMWSLTNTIGLCRAAAATIAAAASRSHLRAASAFYFVACAVACAAVAFLPISPRKAAQQAPLEGGPGWRREVGRGCAAAIAATNALGASVWNIEMARRSLLVLGGWDPERRRPGKRRATFAAKFGEDTDDVILDGVAISHLEQADDVVLFPATAADLQRKIDVFFAWCKVNFMLVSVSKTQWMIFGPIPRHIPTMCVGDTIITLVKQYKFKASKARAVANMTFAVKDCVGCLPPPQGIQLYMAQIDPHLTFGCEVALDVTDTHVSKLEDVQNEFLRRLLGLNRRSVLAVLFSETGVIPLRYRRLSLAIGYLAHLVTLPPNHLAGVAYRDSVRVARERPIVPGCQTYTTRCPTYPSPSSCP
ncbi:hypothetical protein B0H14DRAFT_3464430 [Mycena olivaceomarginata]|nr:hypothetical protein B0H14DRAFT_3464430 [Mycena olivaceomarginata]